jgi:hypothetical protein
LRRLPLRIVATAAALAATSVRAEPSSPTEAPNGQQALVAALSRLIENAIPLEYNKQKDWGATTEIPVGFRLEARGFDARLRKRQRAVNHGVWKHYKLRLVEPEKNLAVQLAELRPLRPGRVAFTLRAAAQIDAWARAKVYQYGIHLIALEMESDMRVRLAIDGELGVQTSGSGGSLALAVMPVVTRAELAIDEFHLRRVSNAHGPVIRELSDGVRHVVEDELGPHRPRPVDGGGGRGGATGGLAALTRPCSVLIPKPGFLNEAASTHLSPSGHVSNRVAAVRELAAHSSRGKRL